MTKKIIFSTGGTGGHIIPAINQGISKGFLLYNYDNINKSLPFGCSIAADAFFSQKNVFLFD